MAKQLINLGTVINDGTGDTLRDGAKKINDNFTELYNFLGNPAGQLSLVSSIVAGEGIQINSPSGNVLVSTKIASSDTVGSVRIGNTLTINNSGVINYNLPTATSSVLGGVKVGPSLTVTPDGAVDYTLPEASTSVLGGVKIDGITITKNQYGIISAEAAPSTPEKLEAGNVSVTLEDTGDSIGRLAPTGSLVVVAGGQNSNENFVQLQWTQNLANPDSARSNYLRLDTDGITLSTLNPVGTQQTPAYSNSLNYDNAGVLTFNGLGKIGPIENATGIDLYASSGMFWAQLNYDNKNFIGANANGVNVDVLGDDGVTFNTWQFSTSGVLTLPLGGDIVDAAGNSIILEPVVLPNTFGSFVVSGQPTITSRSAADTVTLVAGTNITITTNATNNSITIAASGGAGGSSYDQSLNTTDDVAFNTVTASSFVSTSAGVPTLSSATNINLTAANAVVVTASPLRLASITTEQRDLLTPVNGDMIYNTSTNKFQGYQNGAWINLDGTV